MQSSRLKRYRHLVGRFDGLLTRTPVITYGLAIPFAVMGTVDARAAFALSVGMMAISLLSTAVGWVLKRMGQGREVYMLVTAVLSSLTLAGLSRLPLGRVPDAGGHAGYPISRCWRSIPSPSSW